MQKPFEIFYYTIEQLRGWYNFTYVADCYCQHVYVCTYVGMHETHLRPFLECRQGLKFPLTGHPRKDNHIHGAVV